MWTAERASRNPRRDCEAAGKLPTETMERLTYPAHLRGASLELATGRSAPELGLAGWQLTDYSLVLGSGQDCFARASARLLDWRAHAHARVRVKRSGDVVNLQVGPFPSRCLILTEQRAPDRTVLVYGTLPGHVEAGEEAFLIDLHPDGTVIGRCVAFSRPDRFWARLGAPVARAVQLAITRAYLRGMRP